MNQTNNCKIVYDLNNILVGGDGNGHKILILKMKNKELKNYLKFCKLNNQTINYIDKKIMLQRLMRNYTYHLTQD